MLGSGNLPNTWTFNQPTSSDPQTQGLSLPAASTLCVDPSLFSFTRGFVTLVCPEVSAMKLDTGNMAVSRKRSLSASQSPQSRSTGDGEGLRNSAETLFTEAGQSILNKLVKLREKIIANQLLNLKKRLAGKRKRTVSFADDKGLPLEDVRVMDKDTRDTTDSAAPSGEYSVTPWIMAFYQPIFDKRRMKKVFAEKGVALETVDVEDARLSGTVKIARSGLTHTNTPSSVKPCDRVFIRYTHDSWKTHTDIPTCQQPVDLDLSRALTEAVYSFDFPIPPCALHVQFAVCAVSAAGASWDDNDGSNYILLHHSCLESADSGSDSDSDNTKL